MFSNKCARTSLSKIADFLFYVCGKKNLEKYVINWSDLKENWRQLSTKKSLIDPPLTPHMQVKWNFENTIIYDPKTLTFDELYCFFFNFDFIFFMPQQTWHISLDTRINKKIDLSMQ